MLRTPTRVTACALGLGLAAAPAAAMEAGPFYDGPTFITAFGMQGDESDANLIDYLFGFSRYQPGKRVSIFLRKNQNGMKTVATDVPVNAQSHFEVYLDPPEAAITPGGNTILRYMICEYVAGAPGVVPGDPSTLDCGPYDDASSPQWDVDLDALRIERFNGGQDRRTEGRLTAPGGLWFAQSWVFDGPDDGGPGYDDVAWTFQNWGLTPPGGHFGAYRVGTSCNGLAIGPEWCDPAPFIKVNESSNGQGTEFSMVHGGFLAGSANRTLIAMRGQVRDELALAPALFDALFDEDITFDVNAGCGSVADPVASGRALAGLLTVGLARLARRRARRPAGA